jgi:hypothetical protein
MSDSPEWFAAKRYGCGAGPPIAWQGWAITIAFVAVAIALGVEFKNQPVRFIAALAPFLVLFLVVCARTTRGGWRWRWGEKD